MPGVLLDLSLALSVAWLLHGLIERRERQRSYAQFGGSTILLAAFAFQSLSWVSERLILGPREFPPEAPLILLLQKASLGLVLGGAGFAFIRRTRKGLALGAAAGLFFCALGYWARRWLFIAAALKFLWPFWGWFLAGALPFLLAVSFAFSGLALLHDDFKPHRGRMLAGLFLFWSVPACLSELYLRASWGYGPRGLAEAAGVPGPESAVTLNQVWLKPFGRAPYRFQKIKLASASADLSEGSLRKLEVYLRSHRYHTLFAREGLQAVREGWRLHWQAEKALAADMISAGSAAGPDYRSALALLRAGPLILPRYRSLLQLSAAAMEGGRGFEDVAQTQHIFEGFSAACSRFGDEPRARYWLLRIDSLWPIYDKKIEVTPIENVHNGEIGGLLYLDGKPASSIRVGLFYQPATTPSTAKPAYFLTGSVLPGPGGLFYFGALGAGNYYLGLQGEPSELKGAILNSPGVIEISRDRPSVGLGSILIERSIRPSRGKSGSVR